MVGGFAHRLRMHEKRAEFKTDQAKQSLITQWNAILTVTRNHYN